MVIYFTQSTVPLPHTQTGPKPHHKSEKGMGVPNWNWEGREDTVARWHTVSVAELCAMFTNTLTVVLIYVQT